MDVDSLHVSSSSIARPNHIGVLCPCNLSQKTTGPAHGPATER